MIRKDDGEYYEIIDGEEVQCLSPEEMEFMEQDIDGYIEWKINKMKEDGYNFDDIPSDEGIATYYTDDELEGSSKNHQKALEEMTDIFDELDELSKDPNFSYDEYWRDK